MATKISKKDYNDPLAIWNEMSAVDKKDYNFYDRLNDEQKKKFSTYLIMRWASTVEGNNDISKYYNIATNEFVNINLWDLSKHKKLQWLTCCAISPKLGKQKHYWLGAAKGNGSSSIKKLLMEHLPITKEDEIDLILRVNTKEEIILWLRQCGIEEKVLKSL